MTVKPIVNEDLANAIIISAKNVFSTTFNVEVTSGQWHIIDRALVGDFSGTVYLSSDEGNAVFSLVFKDVIIRYILANVYGESIKDHIKENDFIVKDGLSEITNMIFAGVKKILNEKYGYTFTMTIPVVITGENHIVRRHACGNNISLRIPFSCNGNEFFIEVSIDSNSAE